MSIEKMSVACSECRNLLEQYTWKGLIVVKPCINCIKGFKEYVEDKPIKNISLIDITPRDAQWLKHRYQKAFNMSKIYKEQESIESALFEAKIYRLGLQKYYTENQIKILEREPH